MDSELRLLFEIEKLLSSTNSIAEIANVVTFAIKSFGFDKYFYAVWNSNQPFSQFDVELGEYPEPLAKYHDQCLCRTEPVIRYCLENTLPLIWDGEKIHNVKSLCVAEPLEKYREVYSLNSIPAGVLVPLHKVHDEIGFVYAWSETSCNDHRLLQMKESQPFILTLSIYLHNAITRINKGITYKNVKLTKREIQCLQSCQAGKTYKEISASLGITERTVVFHIGNLFKKLGVKNKTQALKKAQYLGIMKSYPTSVI
jgi:DNA-binding CsgD family transcriptional regulator